MANNGPEILLNQTGTVFDVKRFAIHDGPGIRTTVFVKGCNLTCWWCHNPESKKADPELFFYCTKCRACGKCVEACPRKAHVLDGGTHRIDRDRCVLCGSCARNCPFEAVKVVGQNRIVRDVLAEVLEDRHYYATSGGGLTLSGGEPMLQIDFTAALLTCAKANGLHTALDTNGNNGQAGYERILPVTDLFLFDLKQTDPEKYKQDTGGALESVLNNLRFLADRGARILLRCPIIPGVNAEDDLHWRRTAQLAMESPGVIGIEYLPYHRLWIGKQNGLGLSTDQPKAEFTEIPAPRIEEIHAMLTQSKKSVGKA